MRDIRANRAIQGVGDLTERVMMKYIYGSDDCGDVCLKWIWEGCWVFGKLSMFDGFIHINLEIDFDFSRFVF